MDIYILNSLFEPVNLIDHYSSFIWTDRFRDEGEFRLEMDRSSFRNSNLSVGQFLSHSETSKICYIESTEETMGEDGVIQVTITGSSLEGWMLKRRSSYPTRTNYYRWAGDPGSSASYEFNYKGIRQRVNLWPDPYFSQEGMWVKSDASWSSAERSGSTRQGPGDIGIFDFTAPFEGNTTGTYKSLAVTTFKTITPLRPKTPLYFYYDIDELNLPGSARVVIYVDMYSGVNRLSRSTSIPTTTGRIRVTTPAQSYTPNRISVQVIIDNAAYSPRTSIEGGIIKVSNFRLFDQVYSDLSSFSGDDTYYTRNQTLEYTGTPSKIAYDIIEGSIASSVTVEERLPDRYSQLTTSNTSGLRKVSDHAGYWEEAWTGEDESVVTTEQIVNVGPDNLFSVIKQLAETYGYGFYILNRKGENLLEFGFRPGTDRTIDAFPGRQIVFSADLGNLKTSSSIETIRDYRNVAIVFGRYDHKVVTGNDFLTDSENIGLSGFDRSVMTVEAGDIDDLPETEEGNHNLLQRGIETLKAADRYVMFDGEVTLPEELVYERDFATGSVVTLMDDGGTTASARIVEYIFVSDQGGKRQYPTFEIADVTDTSIWKGYPTTIDWVDAPGNWINPQV